MKYLIIIFSICILTSCSQQPKKSVLRGTIKGEIPNKIYYTTPINGVCNRQFTASLSPDSLGNFSIELKNTEPSLLKISTKARGNNYFLIVEPSNYYEIELTISQDGKVAFTNKTATTMQSFYDGLPQEDMMNCRYYTENDIDTYTEISDSLFHDLKTELIKVEKFKKINKRYHDVYELIKNDRKVYYATMISRLACACNINFMRKEHKSSEDILKLWGNAISNVDFSNKEALLAIHAYDLLDFKIWLNMYQNYTVNEIKEVRAKYRKEGLIHSHTISLAKEYLTKSVQEFYIASYITLQSRQKRNQKAIEFIEILNQYNLDYPNSPYLKSFEKNIERIKEQTP
ncbi:hypothetical protein [Labilibacter marinus]|uniref:hypothetical protein n=1 Tax=Labilibacter marinus TaxID=1477105 RepID=UPI00083694E5|nr:hypothetical protein [Labilibacter marinus]